MDMPYRKNRSDNDHPVKRKWHDRGNANSLNLEGRARDAMRLEFVPNNIKVFTAEEISLLNGDPSAIIPVNNNS